MGCSESKPNDTNADAVKKKTDEDRARDQT